MASKMPAALIAKFKGKETKKEEAAEKKAAPTKKGYAAMEKKMEPGMHKMAGGKMMKNSVMKKK